MLKDSLGSVEKEELKLKSYALPKHMSLEFQWHLSIKAKITGAMQIE